MQEYLQKSDAVVVSKKLPLISNLDMRENIALILEVHQNMFREVAEAKVMYYLELLGLADIATKRKNQCSDKEQFYVMMLRAFMCQKELIVVESLFSLLGSDNDIEETIKTIQNLPFDKKVVFLDIQTNEYHYKGCLCNMTK